MTTLAEIAGHLRQTFPTLGEKEIAELALAEQNNLRALTRESALAGVKAAATPSISDIVEKMRTKYMEKETVRIRAKLQSDGSMLVKDTTTYRTYNTHWKRLVELHGELPVSELDQEMIESFALDAQKNALATHKRANEHRMAKGLSAREFTGGRSFNLALDSISVIMAYAVSKKYIPENPVPLIARKKKSASKRRALTQEQIEEIMQTAMSGGNDPVLDYLILWTLLETAGRRGGLIRLQCGDLKIDGGYPHLHLHEKGDTDRMQPISEALFTSLQSFAQARGSSSPHDPVFRYLPNANGVAAPLTMKRFETLWARIRATLPWAEELGVSSHWLRHTTITWIDRHYNHTVAQAFAGHTAATMTAGYSAPRFEELIEAHAALIGGEANISMIG